MDLQKMINSMNQHQSDTRAKYHLTYGELIDALKSAPKKAKVDERFKGIGSWRGSYIEIAIFTDESGYSVEDFEYDYNKGFGDEYKKFEEEHTHGEEKLPTNANELGELLESLIGKCFVGWKGGHFEIDRNKPLWLTNEAGTSGETAIIGLDSKLKFLTKEA